MKKYVALSALGLVVVVASWYSAGQLMKVHAESTSGDVIGTHWKATKTRFLSSGKTEIRISEGWYRLPDKARIEDESQVLVLNGTRRSVLNKKEKTYMDGYHPEHPTHYSDDVFKPAWEIKALQKAGVTVTVHETHADLKGVQYPVVEISSEKVQVPTGQKLGSQHIMAYIDAKTGYMKVEMIEKYDFETGKLIQKEYVEYDYDISQLSDQFFLFQPPDDARKMQ